MIGNRRRQALAGMAFLAAAWASAAEAAPGDGNFSVTCAYSHSAPDDPIVFPGSPGASHLHDFFGSVAVNAHSDADSMRVHPTTCRREADHSGYWVPALRDAGGTSHAPRSADIYYTASGRRTSPVEPFPLGFRMIARDPNRRNDFIAPDSRVMRWRCAGGNLVRGRTRPWCDAGHLELTMVFPDCWDGRPDSRDHSSHVAYSQLRTGRVSVCPASHPRLLPRIAMFIDYATAGGRRFELSSGGQFSGHADFLSAWDHGEQSLLVEQCLNAGRACFSGRPAGAAAATMRSNSPPRPGAARHADRRQGSGAGMTDSSPMLRDRPSTGVKRSR